MRANRPGSFTIRLLVRTSAWAMQSESAAAFVPPAVTVSFPAMASASCRRGDDAPDCVAHFVRGTNRLRGMCSWLAPCNKARRAIITLPDISVIRFATVRRRPLTAWLSLWTPALRPVTTPELRIHSVNGHPLCVVTSTRDREVKPRPRAIPHANTSMLTGR